MSSHFQPPEPRTFGLFNENSALLYHDSPPKDVKVTQAAGEETSETVDTSPSLRFNSLTLDELSEELDRRTRETQRLQEEVETATREALARFACTSGSSPRPESSDHHDFNGCESNQQRATHPPGLVVDDSNQDSNQRHINYLSNEAIEDAVDDCLHQLSDLQLNQMQTQPEQQPSSPQAAVLSLQAQLHNAQVEKDVLSDLRLKDSRKHVDQMEKMLSVLEELQNIKRSADRRLQETEDEALELNRKVETLERTLKQQGRTASEKPFEPNFINAVDDKNDLGTSNGAENSLENLINEAETLRERHCLSKEQPLNEEYNGVKDQKRIQELIVSLGQEMAMLADKLSSSKASGVSLSVKLHLLRTLSERQASLQERHNSKLESTICCHKDKICLMEHQLADVQTQLHIAQRDRDQSLQLVNKLHFQIQQLQRRCEQQQCELRGEAQALRGQLESAREQLHEAAEERTGLQALLEQRAQEGSRSLEVLREKEQELWFRQQEAQQVARLEELQAQCRTLHAEQESLTLKLADKEKTGEALRLQVESSVQTTVQHRHTIDSLSQENGLLSNQLNQGKLEIQQLRADLDGHKSDLATAELERRRLQASASLEKQQLTTQLELQRLQLHTVTKEHKALQRLLSCRKEEHRGAVLKLQSQLRGAHGELQQIRGTLRTLEGADGHGLRVAQDMQKEVTARREQVDSLQSRIQHLEATIEKLQQERDKQNLEAQHRIQELAFVREERKQLADELEALRSNDQQLRDRIGELEAILHKMSESFASCQDFIQLREQEFFRLKLQHALDLKELQGHNLRTGSPPAPDPLTSSALVAPPSPRHPSSQIKRQQRERPTHEPGAPAKDRRGAISENSRPPTESSGGGGGGSHHRRRSAPEGARRAAFPDKAEEATAGSRLRRRTCGSESHFLRTAVPNGNTINTSFGQPVPSPAAAWRCTSSQLLALGRRSPVYSLLTSDPAGT